MFGRCLRLAITLIALSVSTAGCVVVPEPIQNQRLMERSRQDLGTLRSAEFVPTKPIELHEAIARAVAFNLKYRVAKIQRDIAKAELQKDNFDMLPSLDLNASRKGNSVEVSNSDDRISNTATATFAWNILDLGVSYARAKQQADQVLIKQEEERKALQDIIQQVNAAFWQAVAGERLLAKVDTIAHDLQMAVEASREMERTKAADVLSAVAFRRDVVASVKQALAIRRELREAKAQLAELLNIRPGTDFELAMPATKARLPHMPMSVENLEVFALENRPELRIERYNERVSDWQAREALFDMLPGLKLSAGQNYSSDSNSLSPNWISAGVNIGMNLFKLFSGTSEMETAEEKGELARQQRLAMSMAVLTQVHIARIRFNSAKQQLMLAHEISQSDRKLTRLVRTDGQFFNSDFLEAVRMATRELQSEMDEQRAYIDLLTAHTDLMHAVGLDVFPDTVPLDDVGALGNAIKAMMAQWNISDGTAKEPVAGLPLDKLVNSMISVDTRADFTTAAASPGPLAARPPDRTSNLITEIRYPADLKVETDTEPTPPQPQPPAVEATLEEPPDEDQEEAPATAQDAADAAPTVAATDSDAPEAARETAEQLNDIAPSSGGSSSATAVGNAGPMVASANDGRDQASKSAPPLAEISPVPEKKRDHVRSEKKVARAADRPMSTMGPSNDGDPWATLSRVAGWEFSIRPLKRNGAPRADGSPETPDSRRSLERNVRHRGAGQGGARPETAIPRSTVEWLNKIAPAGRDGPPLPLSPTAEWEFSVQPPK